jgi:sulfur carrier protein
MHVMVNGEQIAAGPVLSLAAAVATLTTARAGVAAAVNGEVVRQADWESTMLADGDEVEVLTAVQGG